MSFVSCEFVDFSAGRYSSSEENRLRLQLKKKREMKKERKSRKKMYDEYEIAYLKNPTCVSNCNPKEPFR